MIECIQLTKAYVDGDLRVPVFQGIDLTVQQGERIAIIGVSGVGKSTLLQLMGGLDRPTSGCVRVDGNDWAALSEKQKCLLRNRVLGFVYQFHHLLPEFNAMENVAMPLLIRGVSNKQAIQKSMAMIDRVGLHDRVRHRVGELSGGERQRIAIARALVTEPACVLADEPTGNLDHHTASDVYDLILELNQDLKTSFVVVTHNEALASKMDRTLELTAGGLREKTI